MLIPLVSIHIRLSNGASGTEHGPRYLVPVLRKHLAARLDRGAPGGGLEVVPAADHTPIYREIFSVSTEEAFWRGVYGKSWDDAHPNGIRDEVRKLLEEDAARAIRVQARGVALGRPHESFVRAGVGPAVATACQTAGFPDVRSLPADLVAIAEIVGVDAAAASALLAAREKLKD